MRPSLLKNKSLSHVMPYEEEDTYRLCTLHCLLCSQHDSSLLKTNLSPVMPYEEEDTCMSYAEEDKCMSKSRSVMRPIL